MLCVWSSAFFHSTFIPEFLLGMKLYVDSYVQSDEILHPQYQLHWGKINLGGIQWNTVFLKQTGGTFPPNGKNVCGVVSLVTIRCYGYQKWIPNHSELFQKTVRHIHRNKIHWGTKHKDGISKLGNHSAAHGWNWRECSGKIAF